MKTLNDIKWQLKLAEYRKNAQVVIEMLPNIGSRAKLLDIGCADGVGSRAYAKQAGIDAENVYGIEIDPAYIASAVENLKVFTADIECDELPFPEESFDVVVANQIFEHIKNLRHLMAQIDKVTKTGGHVLISAPNLAALHNRIGLLLGRQPRCMKIQSPHVRGFSAIALRQFVTSNQRFKLVAAKGSGFYPFPAGVSSLLSRLAPGCCVYTSVLLQKTATGGWDYWNQLPDL